MNVLQQLNDYRNKHNQILGITGGTDIVVPVDPVDPVEESDEEYDSKLDSDQRLALQWIKEGRNVLITGQAGTGKSMVLGEVIKWLKKKYGLPTGLSNMREEYAITSMTGISSVSIGGQTLHSWGGIGLAEGSVRDILKVIKRQLKTAHWMTLKVLVIDEVSMMSQELFEKLHQVACILRNKPGGSGPKSSDLLWGGIQLILSGDFLQLPPVGDGGRFCFESEVWQRFMNRQNVIHMTKIYRQDDAIFQNMLSRLRVGVVTPEDRAILQSRVVSRIPNDLILPTKLYPFRRDVEVINNEKYNELLAGGGVGVTVVEHIYQPIYLMEVYEKKLASHRDSGIKAEIYNLRNELQMHSGRAVFDGLKMRENVVVKLCTGAQVMLNYNIDLEQGLANGVKGAVQGFDQDGNPIIQFDGITGVTVIPRINRIHETEFYKLVISQYPLDLAWASTIHKSQGLSLSKVITNLSNVFSPGQSYVSLSRVKSLDGLYLVGIDYNKIKCNQVAKKFYYDLGYYCEFQYVTDCRDLISTSSWHNHPNICDRCLSYFLTFWVNDLPFEINQMIVEFLE